MYDDDGCVGIVLALIVIALISGAGTYFEWQAYVQVVEALGVEPSIPAFIGWMCFGS